MRIQPRLAARYYSTAYLLLFEVDLIHWIWYLFSVFLFGVRKQHILCSNYNFWQLITDMNLPSVPLISPQRASFRLDFLRISTPDQYHRFTHSVIYPIGRTRTCHRRPSISLRDKHWKTRPYRSSRIGCEPSVSKSAVEKPSSSIGC